MKTKGFISIFLLAIMTTAFAQKGIEDGSKYGHGEDSIRCLSNLSLFREYAKQKNYKDALRPWTIVYNECPTASQYIYINGEDIIKWQMKSAETTEDKDQFYKDLMTLYDNRIKYYGNDRNYNEPYITLKKGLDSYSILGDNKVENVKLIQEYLKKGIDDVSLSLKSKSVVVNTLLQAIQVSMALTFNEYAKNEITGGQLITDYEYIQEKLDKIKADVPKFGGTTDQMKENFEKTFANSGAADCETLISMFAGKVEEGKEDKELLEKVLSLFEKTDCTESEVYYSAAEYLHALEPSSNSAYGMAKMYLNPQKQDIDKALEYYNEALNLETDDDRKADLYYQMALIVFSKKKNYVKARELAKNAIAKRSKWGQPYILIGQMYAASAQAQELGAKDIENQAGYWVAVDKFVKAKQIDPSSANDADQQINIYSNYFPLQEDIFFHEGFELNKPYKVGGWINETTICRPKK